MRAKLLCVLLCFISVKGEISVANLTNLFSNIGMLFVDSSLINSIINLSPINFEISNVVSKKCSDQLKIVWQNRSLAITMLDASSKFPYSGILYAGRMDLGNYDQCMAIDHSYDGGKILGKFCPAGLVIPDIENIYDIQKYFKFSICIPDLCSAKDFIAVGKYIFPDFPPIFLDETCSTKETGKEIFLETIILIFVLTILSLIIIISTAYDVYLYKMEIKCRHQLLVAFSIFTNSRKILETRVKSKDHIDIFNGIRVASIMWIIGGHGFGSWVGEYFPTHNQNIISMLSTKRVSAYVWGAQMCVDTFFFISGFLLAYNYVKSKAKPLYEQVKSIPAMYLHRYLRITPAVLMLLLMVLWLGPNIGSGPLYHYGLKIETDRCKKYWWSYMLYIQNYYNPDDICLIPTWYLSVDMQMFLLSPLVLIPISLLLEKSNGFKLSMVGLTILCVLCTAVTLVHKVNSPNYQNYYDTHSRLTDYFMGIMMGIFMQKKKQQKYLSALSRKYHSIVNLIIWVMVLFGMFMVVVFYQDAETFQGHISRSYYFSFSRPAWCLGLCWMIYSCYHGYGGIINWLFTRPIFQIGAKLSYCMYVVHYAVIGYYVLSNRMRWYYSHYVQFHSWCGYLIETIIVAFIWSLVFESPVVIIEKCIFGRRKNFKDTEEARKDNNINNVS